MRRLGNYFIRGLLGRGGMSRVYKVELPVIGKIAALKRLEPTSLLIQMLGWESLRQLFMDEARTMAAIRHPHVVGIWNYEEIEGRPAYLMDYYCNNLGLVIGETYRTEAPSRIIPPPRALYYILQILDGLSRLHHAGIIHRDIKPYNILLTEHDQVKICDFGLSRLRGEKFQGPSNLKVGSPWYAAPEQEAWPDRVDERADLYAAGVMLYRMVTGRLPYTNGPTPPSGQNSDLDGHWDDVILRSMARDPRQRFASAMQMSAALESLHQHWQTVLKKQCNITSELLSVKHEQKMGRVDLRAFPQKTAAREARQVFGLDRKWRPAHHLTNVFEVLRDETIKDLATGLIWQRGGSLYPVDWHQANAYIRHLNHIRYGGLDQWRLPTVAELISLLTAPPQGSAHCLEPVFDLRQNRLWSIDRKSFIAAWYVSADLGYVGAQDFSCGVYVKAVRNASG